MKIFIAFLLSGWVFLSEESSAQVSFGPYAGVQYSSVIGGYSYLKYQWEYGYRAGGFASVPINKNQFLQSGLFINSLGYKYQNTKSSDTLTMSSVYLHNAYLQVPVLWMKNFKSGFHFEGGCFGEFQMSQHEGEVVSYYYPSDSGIWFSESKAESHQITAKRFQAGLLASVGYLHSGFDLSLGSQGNLTTLFRKDEENYKGEHLFALCLSLAYHIR